MKPAKTPRRRRRTVGELANALVEFMADRTDMALALQHPFPEETQEDDGQRLLSPAACTSALGCTRPELLAAVAELEGRGLLCRGRDADARGSVHRLPRANRPMQTIRQTYLGGVGLHAMIAERALASLGYAA